jgi:hypothetical protein
MIDFETFGQSLEQPTSCDAIQCPEDSPFSP